MPYLTLRERAIVNNSGVAINAGELNYQLTRMVLTECSTAVLEDVMFDACLKFLGEEYRYKNLNDVIGALECCLRELVRRRPNGCRAGKNALAYVQARFYAEVVAPYEDAKIAVNGDVYP